MKLGNAVVPYELGTYVNDQYSPSTIEVIFMHRRDRAWSVLHRWRGVPFRRPSSAWSDCRSWEAVSAVACAARCSRPRAMDRSVSSFVCAASVCAASGARCQG